MATPLPLHPASHFSREKAYAKLGNRTRAEAKDFYEAEVFPIAAQAAIAWRTEQPRAELLIVPVGTQPYSPSLASLSTPARAVALLHSVPLHHEDGHFDPGSEPEARRVAKTLDQLPEHDRPEIEFFRLGDGIQGADVFRAVQAALAWAGDPWPSQVTVDLSSGRKATAAALGAIAALSGWRQVYIESTPVHGRFHGHERLHHVADFGQLVNADTRIAATALLRSGHFADALTYLEESATLLNSSRGATELRAFASHFAQSNPDPAALAELLVPWSETPLPELLREAESNVARGTALIECFRDEGLWL